MPNLSVFFRRSILLWMVLVAAVATHMAEAQNQHDMTFHTVPPCTVVDTRVAGGAFAAGETRTYNVVGTGSLAGQGGSATGCGVPGFSNGIAQVQAVALIFTAVTPPNQGYLAANAADQAIGVGVVVTLQPNDVPTNTSQVAVAQTSGVGDFKVLVSSTTSHVVVRVVGYYSKPVQTVYVHPVPGNHTASGTALLNAMNGITNASATKRYVIKLEPGIYDIGSSMLTQKPYVDLEGSGQEATVIQGTGNNDTALETAVLKGASSAEIRDLQIKSAGQGYSYSIALLIKQADTSVRNVTILSDSATFNWGILHAGSTARVEGATITAQGGTSTYGFSSLDLGASLSPVIKRTVINVSGGASTNAGIYSLDAMRLDEVRDVQINASGGIAYGIRFRSNGSSTTGALRLTASTITAQSESSSSYGIHSEVSTPIYIEQSQIRAIGPNGRGVFNASGLTSTVTIDHSEVAGTTSTVEGRDVYIGATRLHGGAVISFGTEACAGVYDESFTFFAGPACP